MIDRDIREPVAFAGPRPTWAAKLPNALTTLALLCGFLATLRGVGGDAGAALTWLLAAALFDAMDGRVARMTNAQSAFGVEYDSLSDMACFGFAPALACHELLLHELGVVGALAAFFYCACAAWRLARFNTLVETGDPRWFVGLPSPAGGILLMGYAWLAYAFGEPTGAWAAWGGAGVAIVAGLLMVSAIPFPSGKKAGRGALLRVAVPALALAGAAAAGFGPLVAAYLLVVVYAIAGPLRALLCKPPGRRDGG